MDLSFCALGQEMVQFAELGFEFQLPEGWSGEEFEKNYLVTYPGSSSYILISSLPGSSKEKFKEDLSFGLQEGKNIYLTLTEPAKDSGDILYGPMVGIMNHNPVRAYAYFCFGPQQIIMVLLADYREKYQEAHELSLNHLVQTLTFFDPKPPRRLDLFSELIVNKRLKSIPPDSEEFDPFDFEAITLELCPEGWFNFLQVGAANASFGYAKPTDNQKGTYALDEMKDGTIWLTLTFEEADTMRFELEYTDGQLRLNEDPFIILSNSGSKLDPICQKVEPASTIPSKK
jgi:hypothetical protein